MWAGTARVPWTKRGVRRTVVRARQSHDWLVMPRLCLDRPIDDPTQIEDGDLHDHHQPDQLPHDAGILPPLSPSTGHRGLQLSADQLSALGVVLRHVDAYAGLLEVDSACGGHTHR